MKLVSFVRNEQARVGVVKGDGLVDLGDLGIGRSVKHILQQGTLDRVWEAADSRDADTALDDVGFLPSVVTPGKVLCIGVNYRKHVLEMGRELPDKPWVFVRFADSFVGHDADMVRPSVSEQYDFEGELAVVIGRSAHRVAAADAFDYVAGYCCLNDGSVRDFQRHSGQFTAGKNFLRSGSMGPWLITRDEVPDPAALQLETRLNGKTMQSSPTSDLIFDIPTLIEYCTTFTRLEPGDVIATGTPGGVGAARTPPVWLQPDDTIEVSISGVGLLRNRIIAE